MIGNIIGAYLTIIATDFLLAPIFCPKQVVLNIPFLSSWSGIVNIDLVNSYFSKEVLSNAIVREELFLTSNVKIILAVSLARTSYIFTR
jgi:hypothetical protein